MTMVARQVLLLGLIVWGLCPVKAYGEGGQVKIVGHRKPVPLVRALEMAVEKMHANHMSLEGRTTVVAQHGRFITVSFILADPKKMRGPRVHMVYDPGRDQILYVLGED